MGLLQMVQGIKEKGLANVRPSFSFLAMVSAGIETIQAICSAEELAPLVSNISFPAEYNFQNRLMAELLALDIK